VKAGFTFGVAAAALLSVGVPSLSVAVAQPAGAASEAAAKAQFEARMKALELQMHPKSGTISIPEAKAHLNLGDQFYFLPAADAKRVLVEAWGNPPDGLEDVLGLVFPAGKTFTDATWGAVVSYDDTGHVSDKDAASQDYNKVLSDMQEAAEADNDARKEQGYAPSHVMGWAQAPTYDSNSKTLIWARNIQFEGAGDNTLNYDVRTLGRTGVLSLNMVDVMPNLPVVQTAAAHLGTTVEFDPGARYADYNASTDKLADYGLAGLVAGGAGLAVAKKAGLLGLLAIFLKKGIAVIAAGALGLGAWLKRKFGTGYQEVSDDGGYAG
jgi:uncharacterized membrane-anchored protein